MKTWIVRAVDSGNIQRSPTFQAIFRYFYSKLDRMPFEILFDSAGIDVDRIMANDTPATRKLDIIDAGRNYSLLKGSNKQLADELVGKWLGESEGRIPDNEKARVTRLYSEIKTDIHTLQIKFRNNALLEAGIPEQFLPEMRVPFRHDEDLGLILPLEEAVMRKVDKYYEPFPHKKPMVRIYGDLAGANTLNDELISGIETARKQVRYFMDTRDRVVERIVILLESSLVYNEKRMRK
jgi:hypothetical protein